MTINKWFSSAGLLVLALVVLFSTVVVDRLFKSARVDLTEGGLYTLSDGSKNIVRGLDQPLDLYFFFSESITKDAPGVRSYAKQVRELLAEFELASKGKLKLTIIDPEPFSVEEDRAAAFGLNAIPLNTGGDNLYFGLVAQYGELEQDSKPEDNARPTLEIPMFQPERQQLLEYDIAKLIYQVSQPGKPEVALISGLDVEGGFNMMMRQPTPPWATVTMLKQLFEVNNLGNDVDEIRPEDHDLLVVIHPKELSDSTLFAIDQYVLRGGHALFFVDPFAELSQSMDPQQSKASDSLEPLFSAWGLAFDPSQFVADAQLALRVGGADGQPVKHLGILQLGEAQLDRDSMISNQLETVHVSSAGFVTPLPDASTSFEPLLTSSEFAMPMAASKLATMSSPQELVYDFAPTGEQYVIATKLSGSVKSAYPDGVPISEASTDAETDSSDSSGDPVEVTEDTESSEYLTESVQPIQVVVVADTDILSDRLWVQVQQFFGQSLMQPFADNGDFFSNAVDLLSGSSDLISIRGQGQYFRPFTLVREMQREAEAEFQQVEQDLRQQLSSIETQLAELQAQQGNADNSLTLTPEVEAQLMQFQQEKLQVRKQLREVQHQLNENIDKLELKLKMINIGLVPLLLTLALIAWTLLRQRQLGRQAGQV